jgi:tetratricopeptide (TPR) repeat protein
LACAAGDREAELLIRALKSGALYALGRYRELLAESEAVLRLTGGNTRVGADRLGYSPAIFVQAAQGAGRSALGDIAGGERDLEQALAMAACEGTSHSVGWCNLWASRSAWLRGDTAASMRRAVEALEVGSTLGLSFLESWGHLALGEAHLLGERWGDAIAALEQALEIIRSRQTARVYETVVLDRLADAHLGAGNIERARALAEEAIVLAERRATFGSGFHAHLTLARTLLRSAGPAARAAIDVALAEAQALVDRTGARSEQPHVHLVRAELADVLGDEPTRGRELREAHRLFAEIGATGWAERVAKELGA